jgi:hypothetical protein
VNTQICDIFGFKLWGAITIYGKCKLQALALVIALLLDLFSNLCRAKTPYTHEFTDANLSDSFAVFRRKKPVFNFWK